MSFITSLEGKNQFIKRYMVKLFFSTAIMLGSVFTVFSQQQSIGFAPAMDGGFENEVLSGAASVLYSTPSYYYTVNNSNSVTVFNGVGGHAGPKYISWTVSGSSSNGFYTPSDNAIQSSSSYVVQFWYRFSSSTGAKSFYVGLSPDGTNAFGSAANTGTLSATTWAKQTVVVTSGSSTSVQNGMVKFTPNSTFSSPYYIDDIVVYSGTSVDNSAPGTVTAPSINTAAYTSLGVQWTAPSGGIDGGGYVVVRYTSDPGSSDAIVQNGIYGVGNAVGAGTVAYIGTNTSFTDVNLAQNTTYYYKIYTADKAFNYSASASVSGATVNNLSLAKLTVTGRTSLATANTDSVAIGKDTATEKLDVNGKVKATYFIGNGSLLTNLPGGSGSGGWSQTGNGGINPSTQFIGTTDATPLTFRTRNIEHIRIDTNGHVGIGTVNTNDTSYKLFVEKGIHTRRVKIDKATWADFVFKDDYKLPTLAEVETFIKINNHLQGIKSEAEVKRDGVDLGDNQVALLQKIEELTLYIIDQNKKLEAQDKKIEQLEKQNAQLVNLQQQLDELKKIFLKKDGTN